MVYSDLDTSGITNSFGSPRWKNAWKEEKMSGLIHFHHRMYGEGQTLIEASDDHLVFARGDRGIVALNKSNKNIEVSMPSDSEWREFSSNQLCQKKKAYLCLVFLNILIFYCVINRCANNDSMAKK